MQFIQEFDMGGHLGNLSLGYIEVEINDKTPSQTGRPCFQPCQDSRNDKARQGKAHLKRRNMCYYLIRRNYKQRDHHISNKDEMKSSVGAADTQLKHHSPQGIVPLVVFCNCT